MNQYFFLFFQNFQKYLLSNINEDENDYNSFKRENNYNEDFGNTQCNKDNCLSSTIKVHEVLKNIHEDSSDEEKDNYHKFDIIEEQRNKNHIRQNRHLDLFETRKNKK